MLAIVCLFYAITLASAHRPSQPTTQPGPLNGPNQVLCVGLTSFVIGTAIGIGLGVLIANNRYRNNGFGGGIWFGRRRKRSVDEANQKFVEAMAKYD